MNTTQSTCFQLRFRSGYLQGQTVSVPCDAGGEVDIDQLSEAVRRDYLFARIMIRRERTYPELVSEAASVHQSV